MALRPKTERVPGHSLQGLPARICPLPPARLLCQASQAPRQACRAPQKRPSLSPILPQCPSSSLSLSPADRLLQEAVPRPPCGPGSLQPRLLCSGPFTPLRQPGAKAWGAAVHQGDDHWKHSEGGGGGISEGLCVSRCALWATGCRPLRTPWSQNPASEGRGCGVIHGLVGCWQSASPAQTQPPAHSRHSGNLVARVTPVTGVILPSSTPFLPRPPWVAAVGVSHPPKRG